MVAMLEEITLRAWCWLRARRRHLDYYGWGGGAWTGKSRPIVFTIRGEGF